MVVCVVGILIPTTTTAGDATSKSQRKTVSTAGSMDREFRTGALLDELLNCSILIFTLGPKCNFAQIHSRSKTSD